MPSQLLYMSDIDECVTGAAQCQHTCYNNYGSYSCGCMSGYRLESDGLQCEGTIEVIMLEYTEVETLNTAVDFMQISMNALRELMDVKMSVRISLVAIVVAACIKDTDFRLMAPLAKVRFNASTLLISYRLRA